MTDEGHDRDMECGRVPTISPNAAVLLYPSHSLQRNAVAKVLDVVVVSQDRGDAAVAVEANEASESDAITEGQMLDANNDPPITAVLSVKEEESVITETMEAALSFSAKKESGYYCCYNTVSGTITDHGKYSKNAADSKELLLTILIPIPIFASDVQKDPPKADSPFE